MNASAAAGIWWPCQLSKGSSVHWRCGDCVRHRQPGALPMKRSCSGLWQVRQHAGGRDLLRVQDRLANLPASCTTAQQGLPTAVPYTPNRPCLTCTTYRNMQGPMGQLHSSESFQCRGPMGFYSFNARCLWLRVPHAGGGPASCQIFCRQLFTNRGCCAKACKIHHRVGLRPKKCGM